MGKWECDHLKQWIEHTYVRIAKNKVEPWIAFIVLLKMEYFLKNQFLTIHLQRNTVIDQVILSNNGLKEIHTTLCRYQKSRY